MKAKLLNITNVCIRIVFPIGILSAQTHRATHINIIYCFIAILIKLITVQGTVRKAVALSTDVMLRSGDIPNLKRGMRRKVVRHGDIHLLRILRWDHLQ